MICTIVQAYNAVKTTEESHSRSVVLRYRSMPELTLYYSLFYFMLLVMNKYVYFLCWKDCIKERILQF